jgi:hypothetical protein
MLLSRIQSSSALFNTIQYGFATKNLKQIKIRMKAVESIKKITKVNKILILGHEDGSSFKNEARRWKT